MRWYYPGAPNEGLVVAQMPPYSWVIMEYLTNITTADVLYEQLLSSSKVVSTGQLQLCCVSEMA